MSNYIESTTTVLQLLKRGWTLTTPDRRFVLIPRLATKRFDLYRDNRWTGDYELSAGGLKRAIDEMINLPF